MTTLSSRDKQKLIEALQLLAREVLEVDGVELIIHSDPDQFWSDENESVLETTEKGLPNSAA